MWTRRVALRGGLCGLWAVSGLGSRSAGAAPRPVVQHPFVVVLDPGHGGSQPGCRGHDGDVWEKDVTFALARRVREALRADLPEAEVHLTRERDETMTLVERLRVAHAYRADVFVSLHANASVDHTQQGFETYVLSADRARHDAAYLAYREATQQAGDGAAARIVWELRFAENRRRALTLARLVQSEQARRFPRRVDRGVKEAPFDVLAGARMPAILFELGFIDHVAESQAVLAQDGADALVEGLGAALVAYYREVVVA